MCEKVGIGFNTSKTILGILRYKQLCVSRVPQMLMSYHKEQRVQASADLLECYEAMGNFLDSIIIGDDT
jgi:hypothetical protein